MTQNTTADLPVAGSATPPSVALLQPWLHDLVSVLCAPTVALGAVSGQIERGGAQGVLHSDIRVLSRATLTVDGQAPTPIGHRQFSSGEARFVSVARNVGDASPDPTVRLDRTRTLDRQGMVEAIELTSTASSPVALRLGISLSADLARIETIKSGITQPDAAITVQKSSDGVVRARWRDDQVAVSLAAPGAKAEHVPGGATTLDLSWDLVVAPGERRAVQWSIEVVTAGMPVAGVSAAEPRADFRTISVAADDSRIAALAARSFADLTALRMAPAGAPDDVFLAAGSPWFFTLFGRDSIWAARMLLPFGTDLAAGTLRALATFQGTVLDPETAQQPGKIPHELRAVESVHEAFGDSGGGTVMTLPPLYYGTIDATPLWICLLHDAWRWGMLESEITPLLPALQRALGWLRDYADADGDGFLEYHDASGHGLANQGWKDSGDSVRWSDGHIAEGPVALCEVQGYAYEAALHGADLLEHFGLGGATEWRAWAAAMQVRFRSRFWVERGGRRYPALALDGAKQRVDSLTSNIGHLLGTGILSAQEADTVADLLAAPDLASGYGLRTMSSDDAGFSTLSYHCGSVWAHDTAIAIDGLNRTGHASQAGVLIEGLLNAAEIFDYRLPELYSGDASTTSLLVAYPAACRPQAWAAAAIGPILTGLTGLRRGHDGQLEAAESPGDVGAIRIVGLRDRGRVMSLHRDHDGLTQITGADARPQS